MSRISKNITGTAFAVLLYFILFPAPTAVHAAVLINEILPKTDPVTHQWIELYNNGPEAVSLNLWTLQNTNGISKTYNMGALVIPARGFLVFPQAQTGIVFDIGGDTLRLTDDKHTTVDSQSYEGTLGYNTTVGRTTDGGGVWATCTSGTPGLTNNCPVPAATPTPTAGPTNTPTPIPATPAPSPAPPVYIPPPVIAPPQILGVTYAPSPKPAVKTVDENSIQIEIPNTITVPKKLLIQILAVAGAWLVLVGIAIIHTRLKRRRRVGQTPPPVAQ